MHSSGTSGLDVAEDVINTESARKKTDDDNLQTLSERVTNDDGINLTE